MSRRSIVSLILVIVAVVCFVVAWWISSGNSDDWTNPTPWGYFGLAAFAAAFLPSYLPPR